MCEADTKNQWDILILRHEAKRAFQRFDAAIHQISHTNFGTPEIVDFLLNSVKSTPRPQKSTKMVIKMLHLLAFCGFEKTTELAFCHD